jgi:hypothetical protein
MCTCVYIFSCTMHGAPTSTAVLTLLTMLTTTFSCRCRSTIGTRKRFARSSGSRPKAAPPVRKCQVPIRTTTTPASCAYATASASTHGHTEAHAHQPRTMQPNELIVATGTLRVIFRWHRWHATSLRRKCVVRRRRATRRRSQCNRCCSARHRYATTAVLLLYAPGAAAVRLVSHAATFIKERLHDFAIVLFHLLETHLLSGVVTAMLSFLCAWPIRHTTGIHRHTRHRS